MTTKQTPAKTPTKLVQGDVILRELNRLPKGAKLSKAKAKILQESEVTGHHHQFLADADVDLYVLPVPKSKTGYKTITENGNKVIVVNSPSWLFHGRVFDKAPAKTGTGDHNALLIPPGIYEIDIQREWDYDFNEETRVKD
jgi:hypothetical protein